MKKQTPFYAVEMTALCSEQFYNVWYTEISAKAKN